VTGNPKAPRLRERAAATSLSPKGEVVSAGITQPETDAGEHGSGRGGLYALLCLRTVKTRELG